MATHMLLSLCLTSVLGHLRLDTSMSGQKGLDISLKYGKLNFETLAQTFKGLAEKGVDVTTAEKEFHLPDTRRARTSSSALKMSTFRNSTLSLQLLALQCFRESSQQDPSEPSTFLVFWSSLFRRLDTICYATICKWSSRRPQDEACGGPCAIILAQVGNKSAPEVLFSGAVHGDERLGPVVAAEVRSQHTADAAREYRQNLRNLAIGLGYRRATGVNLI